LPFSRERIFGIYHLVSHWLLYSGYGYQVRIVEDLHNIDQDMAGSMEWALAEIKNIQTAARTGKPIVKPRWPVLIMRTPKVGGTRYIIYL
jgi:xylulose-5-phosphate/fructose-6-phosphate phosphoketolase